MHDDMNKNGGIRDRERLERMTSCEGNPYPEHRELGYPAMRLDPYPKSAEELVNRVRQIQHRMRENRFVSPKKFALEIPEYSITTDAIEEATKAAAEIREAELIEEMDSIQLIIDTGESFDLEGFDVSVENELEMPDDPRLKESDPTPMKWLCTTCDDWMETTISTDLDTRMCPECFDVHDDYEVNYER